MSNSIDFRADQIQTKQIIVKNTSPDQSRLLIYGIEAEGTPVNEGVINTTHFPQNGIGTDVFLFVSGAVNTKGSATERGTSVFGGDVVVSGSLYQGSARIKGGNYSFAHGNGVEARGEYSHAEGRETIAIGSGSHAEGRETRAIGSGSHAEGDGGSGYAGGNYSHTEGGATIAYGEGSHAEGYKTNASGDYCHAEGQDTYVTTKGDWGHAEGHLTKVDNRYAHTEGYGTLTNGLYSHAEGYLTTGSGDASHAEGFETVASGFYSHSEGYQTIAFGTGSHASGYGTVASGAVDGTALSATSIIQTATGRFNERGNTTSLFVVGNGTADVNRKDLFSVDSINQKGMIKINGGISYRVGYLYYVPTTSIQYTLTLNDYLVFVNVTAGGPFRVDLPPSATTPLGTTYVIRRIDGNIINNIVNIYCQTGDYILDNAGIYVPSISPLPITGNALTVGGGCVTITYIGIYNDGSYGNHPTWITTNEIYL